MSEESAVLLASSAATIIVSAIVSLLVVYFTIKYQQEKDKNDVYIATTKELIMKLLQCMNEIRNIKFNTSQNANSRDKEIDFIQSFLLLKTALDTTQHYVDLHHFMYDEKFKTTMSDVLKKNKDDMEHLTRIRSSLTEEDKATAINSIIKSLERIFNYLSEQLSKSASKTKK